MVKLNILVARDHAWNELNFIINLKRCVKQLKGYVEQLKGYVGQLKVN